MSAEMLAILTGFLVVAFGLSALSVDTPPNWRSRYVFSVIINWEYVWPDVYKGVGWCRNSTTMEPELPQHDLITTCVNASQYSFVTFPSHKEKFAARFKSVCNFFLQKLLEAECLCRGILCRIRAFPNCCYCLPAKVMVYISFRIFRSKRWCSNHFNLFRVMYTIYCH